jgi:hypothetical protein
VTRSTNALAIAEESNIVLDPLDDFNYSIPFSGYNDPIAKIRKRCEKRAGEGLSRSMVKSPVERVLSTS